MFDFMAICEACGRRDLGSTWGKGTSTCEGCWALTESAEAKFCEPCANRKNRCKFCATDLEAEFQRITGGKYRRPKPAITLPERPARPFARPAPEPPQTPLPAARLVAKNRPVPGWIVTMILGIVVLAAVSADYWFLILRYR